MSPCKNFDKYQEDISTGGASKDNARTEKPVREDELLAVGFGTSCNDNRAAERKASRR